MDHQQEKKTKKPRRVKASKAKDDFSYLIEEVKSIKNPTNFAEKESLLSKLKQTLIDIDKVMKQLVSKRDYYSEIILVIENDIKKRNEVILKQNQGQDHISIIQEELYMNSNEKECNNVTQSKELKIHEISDMKNSCNLSIQNYEDFNDLNNCQGLIEFNAHEEQDDNFNDDSINLSKDKVKDDMDHDVILRESNSDNTILSQVKEEKEEEEILEDKYKLFKKPKGKKKAKKGTNLNNSSQSIKSNDSIVFDSSDFPDIESLDDEKLKEQCKIYGLKPSTAKAMKKQLKDIFTFLTTKQLPEKIKKNLTDFLSNDEEKGKNNYSKEKEAPGSKSVIGVFNDIKRKQIIEAIKDDKELWEKILLFKKIELKEVKTTLTKAKIIVGNDVLKNFLIELGVVFGGGWNKDSKK